VVPVAGVDFGRCTCQRVLNGFACDGHVMRVWRGSSWWGSSPSCDMTFQNKADHCANIAGGLWLVNRATGRQKLGTGCWSLRRARNAAGKESACTRPEQSIPLAACSPPQIGRPKRSICRPRRRESAKWCGSGARCWVADTSRARFAQSRPAVLGPRQTTRCKLSA